MDLRLKLDKKLNDRRMSVQGAKPNKVKNSNLPTKAELLDKFDDAVSEEDEADGDESDGNKNKKKEKKDNNKDDSEDEKDDPKEKKK
jgi:hypothetical protein